jgi:hypothetical protein
MTSRDHWTGEMMGVATGSVEASGKIAMHTLSVRLSALDSFHRCLPRSGFFSVAIWWRQSIATFTASAGHHASQRRQACGSLFPHTLQKRLSTSPGADLENSRKNTSADRPSHWEIWQKAH